MRWRGTYESPHLTQSYFAELEALSSEAAVRAITVAAHNRDERGEVAVAEADDGAVVAAAIWAMVMPMNLSGSWADLGLITAGAG